MKTPENDWASTHRAMEECLLERQKFIEKLLVDIRKAEDGKKDMLFVVKMVDDITDFKLDQLSIEQIRNLITGLRQEAAAALAKTERRL